MKKISLLRKLGFSALATLLAVGFCIIVGHFIIFPFQDNPETNGSKLIYLLTIFGLMTISFFTILFPSYQQIFEAFEGLIKSEEHAKKMTSEISKLYRELAKSYQDLEAVNLIAEEPIVLMKIDKNGDINYISDKLKHIMLLPKREMLSNNFFSWLSENGYNPDFLENLKSIISKNKPWNGELKMSNYDGDFIWLNVILQPVHHLSTSILVIGQDVAEIKEAKERSREINRETIEKKVKEQQYRSALILEGQEEERKRIAQEIHDGIGQLLTGLKLNLEGIVPTNSEQMKKRMTDTKELMGQVIKEVRRVSFNLTPSSLVDFGLAPALKKISQEVSSLTNVDVQFENKTGFINRLDKNVETNLYRIVQEAVNNSIKYAKAEKIEIILSHSLTELSITIEDNGQGFEKEKLEKSGHFGSSGHGIFNMKERAAYINGELQIETEPEMGTKINVKISLT